MSSQEFDFWLLDLDGTLVDVETSYIYEVLDDVGERLGVSFSGRESEHLWYGYDGMREQILTDAGIDSEQFWAVFHEVEEPETRAQATHLYPDAESFVSRLDTDVGLVTHCQEYLTEPVLDTLDITDWFETVVCCTDETGWKPDPKPVEIAMSDLGVAGNGSNGVMVGDDPQDVGAAWNAGLTGIQVTRHDPERYGQSLRGDRCVSNLTELSDTSTSIEVLYTDGRKS